MNNNDNRSADHHSYNEDNSTREAITIINCVLNAPLMLISILGNALVLAAIKKTSSIRSTQMIMLCSLAVSDLLVGLITQPIYIVKELTKDRYLNYVWKIIGPYLCGVSLFTITAITVDRFLALHYHMRYATLLTEFRVKYILIIIWFISLLAPFFYFWKTSAQIFLIDISIVICLIISTVSYIRIYHIVRRHQFHINAQQQAVQSSDAENNSCLNITRLRRSAMNTFVLYVVLIICYLPVNIVSSVGKDWKTAWKFSSTLVFSNSCINPFLYCWRLREIRAAIVKTAKQVLCQQTEQH